MKPEDRIVVDVASTRGLCSTDAEHVPGLIPPLGAFAGPFTWRLGLLVLADQGEEAPKPFVLQDGCLSDAPQPVEGAVGHAAAFSYIRIAPKEYYQKYDI